jgi:hypothetical protein
VLPQPEGLQVVLEPPVPAWLLPALAWPQEPVLALEWLQEPVSVPALARRPVPVLALAWPQELVSVPALVLVLEWLLVLVRPLAPGLVRRPAR